MENKTYYILNVKLQGTKRSYKTASKKLAYQKMQDLFYTIRKIENDLITEIDFSCNIEKYEGMIKKEEIENIRGYV